VDSKDLGLVLRCMASLALATACLTVAACATRTSNPPAPSTAVTSKGAPVPSTAPACGDRIEPLLDAAGPLAVTGQFPSQISGTGDGAFTGSMTVTNNGPAMSGVSTPEADVFVVENGVVVALPLPKDLLARQINLPTGGTHTFPARGGIRPCSAGAGSILPPGRYGLVAMVVVIRQNEPALIVAGGPWPIDVT
jgi:hypothetical protein